MISRPHQGMQSMANGSDSLGVSYEADPTRQCRIAEVSLKRLLKKCEDMAAQNDPSNWRFPKFVEATEELLASFKVSLESLNPKMRELAASRLVDYEFRISVLKKQSHPDTINSIDQRRLLLESRNQRDPYDLASESDRTTSSASRSRERVASEVNVSNNVEKAEAKVPTKDDRRLSASAPSKDKAEQELREELLHQSSPPGLDNILAAEQERQEKITSEMLSLVKTMKENTKLTGQLVKKDFGVIDKASGLADRNLTRLNAENAKLAEQNKKKGSWWILLVLFFLFGVFIMVVLFIRIFPKPKHREL